MLKNNNAKKGLMAAAIAAIVLITYNVSLFSIAGFENHGETFWISYVFAMIAFFVVIVTSALAAGKGTKPKDWLYGYPIFSHCTVYLIVELISSIAFMLLGLVNIPWGIAVAVQMIILGVHLIFNISCFLARDTIREVEEHHKQSTQFMEACRVDVDMLAETAKDPEIKAAYDKLAEAFRFSDPVSSPMLFDVEQRLAAALNRAKPFVQANDKEAALRCCEEINLTLIERNKKCKIYK